MNIPFTTEASYSVFTAYNTAVWPVQLRLLALKMPDVVTGKLGQDRA